MGLIIATLVFDLCVVAGVVYAISRLIRHKKREKEKIQQLHKANDYIEWLKKEWENGHM